VLIRYVLLKDGQRMVNLTESTWNKSTERL